MTKKLTITLSDEVYAALHSQLGRRRIAGFIEQLLRRRLRLSDELERQYAGYAEWLASAERREETAEVADWLSDGGLVGLAADENDWPESWYAKAGPETP